MWRRLESLLPPSSLWLVPLLKKINTDGVIRVTDNYEVCTGAKCIVADSTGVECISANSSGAECIVADSIGAECISADSTGEKHRHRRNVTSHHFFRRL